MHMTTVNCICIKIHRVIVSVWLVEGLLKLRGCRVHPQLAPAKIDNALVAIGEELRFDLVKTAAASGDNAGLVQDGQVFRDLSLVLFARFLRGRGGGESKPAFSDQHQIANVNHRVREIRQDANRIAPENEVNAHEGASGNAPVPERHRNHTFALPLGSEPLDKETHREKGVRNETKDHEITPIQTEEPVFLPDPGDGDDGKCIHRQLTDWAIS